MDFYVETVNGRIGTRQPATGDTEPLQSNSSSGSVVPGEQTGARTAPMELSESVERPVESVSGDTLDSRDGVSEVQQSDDSVCVDGDDYEFTETFNPYNWGMGRTKLELHRPLTNFGNWWQKPLTISNLRDILREQFPIIRRVRADLWRCVVGGHTVKVGSFFDCWLAAGLPHWVEHHSPHWGGWRIQSALWTTGELTNGCVYGYEYFIMDLDARDSRRNVVRRVRAQRKYAWEL